ncbi:MAG TPA: type II toxin-antitoxin system HicA family toxin [Ktedonobacterales bacterium]|nr:type II toxin-antitoxin system HicA family toxin [Ktedonobacterales bacterium]
MAIDFAKLRGLTARELAAGLLRDSFLLERQKGSHRLYRHPDKRRVTVSYHASGDTFRQGTLRSMIEQQACWTLDDLRRLKLLN